MARRYKVTAVMMIICMCVLTMFPEQAMAQETTEQQETQTTEETAEQQEVQTTEEEDAAATLGGQTEESSATTEDLQSNDTTEMTEEAQAAENDDPGQGRLNGDIPTEFYGGSLQTRSSSPKITHNSKFAKYSKYRGIDVSKWNGNVNWTKVKAAGIDFAFVRVGYRGYSGGGLGGDGYAATNMKNAAAAGVKVGAYIFSQAITEAEAREEADYVLSKVKGYNITMPLVFDYEYFDNGRLEKANLNYTKQTKICLAFCERIAAAGYTPCVYANKSMLTDKMNGTQISAKYPVWLAHYTTKTDYTGDYSYWQYTSTGKVSGISGNVDLNFAYVAPGDTLGSSGSTGNSTSTGTTTQTTTTVGKTTLSGKAGSFDSVKLSWKKVSGANGYVVYRYDSSSKSYKKIKTISSGSTVSYTDGSKNASTTYKYCVKAYKKSGGKTYYSASSNAVSVKTSGSATGKTTGTSVNVRSGPSTSKSRIKKLGVNQGVTLTGSTGNWYRISIKISGKKKTGYISKDYVTIIKKPTLKATAKSSSKIKLTWNKISGAKGYQIQRYNSSKKKWVTVKTIKSGSTVSYTNSGLKKKTTYKYRIRSYKTVRGRKIYSYYCSATSAKTK